MEQRLLTVERLLETPEIKQRFFQWNKERTQLRQQVQSNWMEFQAEFDLLWPPFSPSPPAPAAGAASVHEGPAGAAGEDAAVLALQQAEEEGSGVVVSAEVVEELQIASVLAALDHLPNDVLSTALMDVSCPELLHLQQHLGRIVAASLAQDGEASDPSLHVESAHDNVVCPHSDGGALDDGAAPSGGDVRHNTPVGGPGEGDSIAAEDASNGREGGGGGGDSGGGGDGGGEWWQRCWSDARGAGASEMAAASTFVRSLLEALVMRRENDDSLFSPLRHLAVGPEDKEIARLLQRDGTVMQCLMIVRSLILLHFASGLWMALVEALSVLSDANDATDDAANDAAGHAANDTFVDSS